MKVLTYTTLFPSSILPIHGIFILERMRRVAELCMLKVVAPIPYFPPLRVNSKWYLYSQATRYRKFSEIEIFYPKYFITPKIGMIFYGLFLFFSTVKIVSQIARKHDFDLIDAHYIYPDGLAAILLGKVLKKKVILSARGTDINLYPKFPLIKRQIVYTLKHADKIIAVCQALKGQMMELGIAEEKIKVISNGVDITKFFPVDQTAARKQLNLPLDKKIILSVGHLIERKGFHFIIDALRVIKKENKLAELPLLVIVGEGEYRPILEKQIRDLNLESDVMLIGTKPHDQLNLWYNSCDIYCLASSREGWPNVLLEAMACGKPVVATRVWGVSEVMKSKDYGILVDLQDPLQLANSLCEALNRNWNSQEIIRYARQNTWDKVARDVYREFRELLGETDISESSSV